MQDNVLCENDIEHKTLVDFSIMKFVLPLSVFETFHKF